jgi:hypothetical protein
VSGIRRALTASFTVMVCATVAPSAARQVQNPCAAVQPNPADVALQLSFKYDQTTFHQGEIVKLVLGFTSTTAQKYFLSTRSYDRSGRMNTEEFCLEPATAGRDPLSEYFGSGIFEFMGGGLGGIVALGATPSVAEIDFNEWKVLPPGQYRLRLRSHRVDRAAAKDEPGSGDIHVPLWSSVVEFRVTAATPEWEAAQLRVVAEALDSGDDERARRGARILRFLESEAATREMARRFVGRDEQPSLSDLRFGLIGSPHRQLAIDSLKAAIADPSRAITADLIGTLALLEVVSSPDYRMPALTESNRDAVIAQGARAREAYQRLVAQHAEEAMAALAQKTGAAQAGTVDALLAAPASAAIDRAALRRMLVASWDSLPVRTRNDLLRYRWDGIGGPDFLPILRRIVNAPPAVPRQGAPPIDRGQALARLYELAPAEGRQSILREMIAPASDVDISVLTLLPDRELPEIEDPLFARLERRENIERGFRLLERYGTSRSFPEVQRAYARARGRWACELQSSALRLFIRADPAFGAAELEFALAQRAETGCYQFQLTRLNETLAVPEVERIAIAALDDPSPEVVRDAAQALGANGSAAAEAALWRRLEAFHEAFKDRPEDLRTGPAFDDPRMANSAIEHALVNAIANGQAWLSARDKLARLKGLVSPWRQGEVTRYQVLRDQPEVSLQLYWSSNSQSPRYDLAGYAGSGLERLIQKLQQFPPGTRIAHR